MDDLRIQIVNYKSKEYLSACLDTLFEDLKTSRLKYSVALLDNASGDDLSDISERYKNRPIEIRYNDKNAGFGAGHNILAKNTESRYLFLLNPDTKMVEPHTIERLLERAENLKAHVIGPRLITEGGRTQWYDHAELHGFKAWAALHSGHSYWRERRDICEAAWVCGAALLIEQSWFERLGGFDENIFMYKDEEELCWRLRAIGGKIIYDPTISIFHHAGVVGKKSKYLNESTEYFLRKHFRKNIAYPFLLALNHIWNYSDEY